MNLFLFFSIQIGLVSHENFIFKTISGLLLSLTESVPIDDPFKTAAKLQPKSKRWGADDSSDFLGPFSWTF